MNSRSNSLSKISNVTVKKESISFIILNIDAKFQESQVQIIVKCQQDVYFLGLNQPFAFDNESRLQIQVVMNNKLFGSVSFKPKVLNKIPNKSIKWISLLDPSDDFYDGDFNEDDIDGPRVLIQFNRQLKQEEKQYQEQQNNTQRFLEKANDQSGIQTNRSSILKEINGELKSNRTSHRESQNCIYSQQNLKTLYKQGFNMKLINEDLWEQITNKEEYIKKMSEQVKFYKVKLEFKEKENEVLSQNIQKVQAQCNNLQILIQQEKMQNEPLEASLKNAESKLQKLTDYLIDLKEKHQKQQLENELQKQKLKEFEERQNQEEDNGYYKEQLEKKKLIIENLRQQIQEFQDCESKKEKQIQILQSQISDFKNKAQEQSLIQIKNQDDEKSQKIEQLIEEVDLQKNQVDSLLEQVKAVLEQQNNLKKEIEEQNNLLILKEKTQFQMIEEINNLKQEINDQGLMIQEQSQHIKNQAKQINDQNHLILKFKQIQEQQKEKTDKETTHRNQLVNENKKLTQIFLEQKQKCAECQIENKKILENLDQKEKKINQLQEENNQLFQELSRLHQQNKQYLGDYNQQQSHINEQSQQFWQRIPVKIADLEKDIAEYNQKHQINLPFQSSSYVQQNTQQVETPTIGLATNQLEESQKTDQYLMISGNTNQYYQSQTVTPFLLLMNSNNENQKQGNREDTNLPVQINDQNQFMKKSASTKLTTQSPFNSLYFCEESFNLNNQDECKQQIQINKPIFDQQNNDIGYKKQFQLNFNHKFIEQPAEISKNEQIIKNDILISELKNKRQQFRALNSNLNLSSPHIKQSYQAIKAISQQKKFEQLKVQNSLSDKCFPQLLNEIEQTQQQNSGAKTKRSQSINQLPDTKNKKSPCSSSQRRNSTNLDTKRWKI
ncbi:hypothetical protein ABPG72_010504 [Tetrahymena utriculariae]